MERAAACAALLRRLTGLCQLRLENAGAEVGPESLREVACLAGSLTSLDLERMHVTDNTVLAAVGGGSALSVPKRSGHTAFSYPSWHEPWPLGAALAG